MERIDDVIMTEEERTSVLSPNLIQSQSLIPSLDTVNPNTRLGVVTYAEAFATRIKMESSDQHSFLEPIRGIKTNSEQLIPTINALT